MARVQKRRPTSPGILAALRARKIAVAALYWGPIIFLLSTIVLVVSLWKGINLGSLQYLAVLLLAAGGVASAWTLQRRLAEISVALERAQRTSTVGLLTAGFAPEMKNALPVVLGFAELARTAAERAQSDAKGTRHLKELENETRRTVAPLQSFLSYSAGEKVARRPPDVNRPGARRHAHAAGGRRRSYVRAPPATGVGCAFSARSSRLSSRAP